MNNENVIIIGGGIAGLAVAHQLTSLGLSRVILLEREELLATHSSGRNAAMFRHLDLSAGGLTLALRSRKLLDALLPGWLKRHGAIFVARRRSWLDPLVNLAIEHQLAHRLMGRADLEAMVPGLRGTDLEVGIHVPDDGVMDIHGMCTALAARARQQGATIRLRCPVKRILAQGGQVAGVELETGELISAPLVVNASGAWASQLGATAGVDLPLKPFRRHIAQLEPSINIPNDWPIVWCVDPDQEVYFRPESGGALASPCDEDSYPPSLPPEAETARELLATRLARLAPPLADSGVRRGWACLRTFAPDRSIVAGPDPRLRGFFWLAGLGGHGMTAGVATGELVARLILGQTHSLASLISPERLLRKS